MSLVKSPVLGDLSFDDAPLLAWWRQLEDRVSELVTTWKNQ